MKELTITSVHDIDLWFDEEPMPVIGLPSVRLMDAPDDRQSLSQSNKLSSAKLAADGTPLPANTCMSLLDDDDLRDGFSIIHEKDDYGHTLETLIDLLG